jgi:hypothetical protein
MDKIVERVKYSTVCENMPLTEKDLQNGLDILY